MTETVGRLIIDLLRRPWTELGATHYLDEYLTSQWLPGSALAALQRAKLRRLVWHCVLESPDLRATIGARLSPSEIERLEDVTRLPIASAPPAELSSPPSARERDARRVAIRGRSASWGAPPDKWWQVPVHGVLAAPCAESGDSLHVHSDHAIVECVGDDGQRAPAGVEGRLLLTDLHELGRPMVRGELGVRGKMPGTPCACGRFLPLVTLAVAAPVAAPAPGPAR